MNKKAKKYKKPSYKKHKGKKAEVFRAHDPEPTMFAFRIKMNFFPQHDQKKRTNVDVGHRLRELMTENDITFDYDDLEIDVKNDTDLHWNDPWPGEAASEDSE
jgi:hypothetical protein